MVAIQILLAAVVAGGLAYFGIVLAAVRRFRREPPPAQPQPPPRLSFLKPLAGNEPELEENLASFFTIDYPDYEILFAVRTANDPAAATAQRLVERRGPRTARLIVTGEPASLEECPNAKVHSLVRLEREATGDVLVISDSDIRADGGYGWGLARNFSDARVGVVTAPYLAKAGASLWSRLEAVGMNTHFWGGVLAAWRLAPMDFAVGPTMAIRRSCLDAVGGFASVSRYLAEDFVLGRRAAEAGFRCVLSRRIVEHRIGSEGWRSNLRHRLRWRRSTRRSRPAGYVGEAFTNPLPLAVLLTAASGGAAWSWIALGACAALRAAAAAAVAFGALGGRSTWSFWALLPLEDFIAFGAWIAGFWGDRIEWRGRRFRLYGDGRLEPAVRL